MNHKLQNGHATRCATPEDRKAIVAICHNAGIPVYHMTLIGGGSDEFPHLKLDGHQVSGIKGNTERTNWISNAEFVARALGHEPKPIEPPIIIDGRTLEFLPGGAVKVGCQTIEVATLDLIHERSKAKR